MPCPFCAHAVSVMCPFVSHAVSVMCPFRVRSAPTPCPFCAHQVVLEARLDRGQGPIVMALLRQGTLAVGAAVVAGTQFGRVRALRDAGGASVQARSPSPCDSQAMAMRYGAVRYDTI